MAAPTEVYVDPSIASDSGTGTIGDPYGDLQYALDQTTRNATDGNRFNIKAGTDEILGSALSLATYGTPTEGANLIFQGYTAVAGDGGIGGISGNSSVSVFDSTTLDFISFIGLKLHSTGSNLIVQVDDRCTFFNCEFHTTTGSGLIVSGDCVVASCLFRNIGGIGCSIDGSVILFCKFRNETNSFSEAIRFVTMGGTATFNVIDIGGSSDGIHADTNGIILNNSIFSNGGTGRGIRGVVASETLGLIFNNLVTGFSGSGGIGIDVSSDLLIYGNNALRNNATNYAVTGGIARNLGGNETLTASPFLSATTDDFRVETTVRESAYPLVFPGLSVRSYVDKGALQRKEPGGRLKVSIA